MAQARTTSAQMLGMKPPAQVLQVIDEALHFGVFRMQYGLPTPQDWNELAEVSQTLSLACSRWPKLKMPTTRQDLDEFSCALLAVRPRLTGRWHVTADELADLRRGAAAGSAIARGATMADLAYGRAKLNEIIEKERSRRDVEQFA